MHTRGNQDSSMSNVSIKAIYHNPQLVLYGSLPQLTHSLNNVNTRDNGGGGNTKSTH
jgi:hypothetical protein